MRRGLLLCTSCIAIGSVAPAAAEPLQLGSEPFLSSRTLQQSGERTAVSALALTDDGALWITGGPLGARRRQLRLRRGRPGAEPRTLARLASWEADETYESATVIVGLDVSGGHVTFSSYTWDEAAAKYTGNSQVAATARILAITPGKTTTVVECSYFGSPVAAVEPGLLITTGCGAPVSSTVLPGARPLFQPVPVDLRDPANPTAPPTRLTDSAQAVRAAGRVVGWRAQDALVAWNVDTAAEVNRLPLAWDAPINGWDVQADGKLTYASSGPQESTIVWSAPGEPPVTIHQAAPVERLRLAGDQLAFIRREPAYDSVIVRPLHREERVLAHFGAATSADPAGPLAFDGARVAFAAAACDATRILITSVTDPTTATLGFGPCPVTLDEAPPVTSRGRLRVEISCPRIVPSEPNDRCRSSARATLAGRVLATARAQVRAERTATLVFSASRRLQRDRPRRLSITIHTRTRVGVDRRTVTVRPIY